MVRLRRGTILVVLVAAWALAQEAPLLTVLPRAEQVRQLQLQGDLHMVRKRYPEAIDAYGQALHLSPRNAVLLNKIGIAYHQLSRLRDAKKYYELATEADKNYAYAWNNLGTAHYGMEKYWRAIRYYHRALKLDPSQASFHSNLGTALFARKQYPEATEEFRVAVLLDPEVFRRRDSFGVVTQDFSVQDRARFNYLLAKTYASLGYLEDCLLALRHALDHGLPPEEARLDPAFAALHNDERFQALFATPQPPQP